MRCFVVMYILTWSVYLVYVHVIYFLFVCFFFQAEDGIRDLVRSRGLGDVYKRQPRQSGKTTLCRQVFPTHAYVSMEAPDIRRAVMDLSLIHI